jgi:hypothetical protein
MKFISSIISYHKNKMRKGEKNEEKHKNFEERKPC